MPPSFTVTMMDLAPASKLFSCVRAGVREGEGRPRGRGWVGGRTYHELFHGIGRLGHHLPRRDAVHHVRLQALDGAGDQQGGGVLAAAFY